MKNSVNSWKDTMTTATERLKVIETAKDELDRISNQARHLVLQAKQLVVSTYHVYFPN